jgi:membrane protein implicated in regulation of membrane protease activity
MSPWAAEETARAAEEELGDRHPLWTLFGRTAVVVSVCVLGVVLVARLVSAAAHRLADMQGGWRVAVFVAAVALLLYLIRRSRSRRRRYY